MKEKGYALTDVDYGYLFAGLEKIKAFIETERPEAMPCVEQIEDLQIKIARSLIYKTPLYHHKDVRANTNVYCGKDCAHAEWALDEFERILQSMRRSQ